MHLHSTWTEQRDHHHQLQYADVKPNPEESQCDWGWICFAVMNLKRPNSTLD